VRLYRRKTHPKEGPQLTLPLQAAPCQPATPSPADQRKRAFDSFRFSLPKDVAAGTERFQSLQWPLLILFQKQPRAVEVCRSNPAIRDAARESAQTGKRVVLPPEAAR